MKKSILISIFLFSYLFSRDCINNYQSIGRDGSYMDEYKISQSGWFKVHYDVDGVNAANDDYIDQVLIIADSVRYFLKNIMMYQDPPIANNDDPYYHVFIKSNYNYPNYGVTVTGNYLNGELMPSRSSYIEIDNNYEDYYVHNGLDPVVTMRETFAHEYFHAVQLSYRTFSIPEKYFFELSSMWFEDLVVPDGNDWTLDIWTDALFKNPNYPLEWNQSFTVDSPDWGYSLGLFGHYLSRVVDGKGAEDESLSTIMREIWEMYGSNYSFDAFDAIRTVCYNDYNKSMHLIWLDFMTKNLFNSMLESEFHYFEDQSLISPLIIDLEYLNQDISKEIVLNNRSANFFGYKVLNKCSIELEHFSSDFISNTVILNNSNNSMFETENIMDLSINSEDNIFFVYSTENTNSSTINLSLSLNFLPIIPSNVFAFQVSHDQIELTWSASDAESQDNNSYNVYRNGDKINNEELVGFVFKDIDFESNTSYVYTITSSNDFGESEYSLPSTIITWPSIDEMEYNIAVYPNPCKNRLNLLLDSKEDYSNQNGNIYNIKGQKVESFNIDISRGRQRLNLDWILEGLSAGYYLIIFDDKKIPDASFSVLK